MNILKQLAQILKLYIANLIVPIGCSIAYHQNLFTIPPVLPDNWLINAGQVVNNPKSPLNGKILPNMINRIIIGNTTSGTLKTNSVKSGAGYNYYTIDMVIITRIY